MCRNIRRLHHLDPPCTPGEVRDAALQFVRKISGSSKPSRANAVAFETAIEEIARATERFLGTLVTSTPPLDRVTHERRTRERSARRSTSRPGGAPPPPLDEPGPSGNIQSSD